MGVRVTILLVLALAITTTEAVDKNKFRTCAQTSFCTRNRLHSNPTYVKQDYQLVNPISDDASASLSFELHNARFPLQQSLSGHIQIYTHGIPRLTIKEKTPLHGRHVVRDVLTFEEGVASSPRTLHIHTNTKWTSSEHVDSTTGHRSHVMTADSVNPDGSKTHIHITYSPFVMTYSVNGEQVAVINGRGLLNVEQQREKNPRPPPHVPEVVPADPVDTQTSADGTEATATPPPPPPQPVEFDPAVHPFDFDLDGMWEESHGGHTDNKQHGPEAISLDVSFIGSQHVYGIPEHASEFALRSTVGASTGDYHEPYRLYNLDVFEYELDVPMSLYGAVPFMVSHTAKHTVGFFWLNAAETYIDIADANIGGGLFSSGEHRKDTQWISESGIIDAWLLPGPTPQAVNYQYALLTGFPAMPQHFAIAYHQCRWNYKSQDDVKDVDAGFDTWDIPYDVLWLDIEHTDGKKYFTWDKTLFPQPAAMQDALAAKGRKMVTIVDPHIKRDTGYRVHTEAQEKGLYVKNKDRNDYEGWCWPGSVSYLDFLSPEVRSFWASKFALDSYEGSTKNLFIWNDMNEPSVFNGPEVSMPKDCLHNGGTVPHRDVHNQYGFYTQMATQQGLIERDGTRPFVLTRAFFAGSQRYGAVWTGDNAAEWSHLEVANPMLLSLNIAGITFSGADVGGFFKDPPVPLLVRWYQTAAYQPFFRAHAHIDTKRREPWLFGEPHTTQIRDAVRTRYALLPYVYTVFAHSHWTGQPIVRPLWYHFPTDATTFAHQTSFLLGHDILVHPVTHDNQWTTSVYLPGTSQQIWYDVVTDTPYVGGTTYSIDTPITKTPVFQRGGSIIPRRDRIRRSSRLMEHDPITLYIALDAHHHANGTIYMDDGHSFRYQSGAYLYRVITYDKHIITSKTITDTTYDTDVRVERVVIVGLPDTTSYTQAKVTDTSGTHAVSVSRHGTRVIIRKPDVNIGQDFKIELQN